MSLSIVQFHANIGNSGGRCDVCEKGRAFGNHRKCHAIRTAYFKANPHMNHKPQPKGTIKAWAEGWKAGSKTRYVL